MLHIYGPGGVGGLIAGVLAKNGQDVVVVATPRTADAINNDGLVIRSKKYGNFSVRIKAVTKPARGAQILLTTKAYALENIAKTVKAANPSELGSLFNGFAFARRVHDLTEHESWCGSIRVFSSRTAPGVIEHTSKFMRIELPDSAMDGEISRVLLEGGLDVGFGGTEEQVLWRKFRSQSLLALLTAATNLPIGAALQRHPDLVKNAADELARLSTLMGLRTSRSDVIQALTAMDPDATSSLARDVAAGKPTSELKELGTDILELASRNGIPTPALAVLVSAVEDRVRGRRA
ncbi:ketopantoate reductase family protein [Actinobaculum suis]|uniref:ketopantoate reductase family protein n=1 Tax=Actinobaculum suis TaxID=1657 RepID=UPI0008087487|nr:2-dehydropantoate 2-reductase N-terminal domain-containing protein [Actinobaculum suis]OCA94583.1 2-dehydropantoate 2-reductase [Actinobaculum suis]OCA94994.1 2-dehydropantoate 2-reductase [Actinobaculum suis]